ncbi:MAG: folate family ECF transporter S component [Ruminococcaceae bacterium]|nr:folate family ECF transporter S component [Oscillospiraceae bacterium]
MSKRKNEEKIFKLVCLALLTAMQIVIARILVIPLSESLRISFSFIPVVIAARSFGVVGAVTVYGLGDFIGAVAFPTTGAYFPGFTLTAVVSGLIYGLFLRKKTSGVRIVLSVVLSQLLCTVLMNSYWISTLYGAPFAATALSRLGQAAVMGTVQIVFMLLCLERICSRISFGRKDN